MKGGQRRPQLLPLIADVQKYEPAQDEQDEADAYDRLKFHVYLHIFIAGRDVRPEGQSARFPGRGNGHRSTESG